MTKHLGRTLISIVAALVFQNALAQENAGETAAAISMHKKGYVSKSQNFAFPEVGYTGFEIGTAQTKYDGFDSSMQETKIKISHGFAENAMLSVQTGFTKTANNIDGYDGGRNSATSITPVKASVMGVRPLENANLYFCASLLHGLNKFTSADTAVSFGEADYYGATTLIPAVGYEQTVQTGLLGFEATGYTPLSDKTVREPGGYSYAYRPRSSLFLKAFYEVPMVKWAQLGTGFIYGSSKNVETFDVVGLTAYSQIQITNDLSVQVNLEGYNHDSAGAGQNNVSNLSLGLTKTL